MGCAMSVGLSADLAKKAFPAASKKELQEEQFVLDTFFKDRWMPMSPSTPRSPMIWISPHQDGRFQLDSAE